ncbi:MAG: hypothetical protein N2053_05405 [Chitinispirillaceae bacterium]|nr:hypothetical protein [Chitinispirillaceae bacterium]
MSIRWIRNVIIDGEKSTLEIQLGDKKIGDKCYVRVNHETEIWFNNESMERTKIIAQGIELLKKKLKNKKITNPDGTPYDWK